MKKSKISFILFTIISLTSCSNNGLSFSFEENVDNDVVVYKLNDSHKNEFQQIFENENFIYSFKDSNDVLQIYDKRNDYTWKTGIDMVPYTSDYCSILSRDERKKCYKENNIVEGEMSSEYYLSLANSLISIELYSQDGSNYSTAFYGSSMLGTTSKLYNVENEKNHFKFVVDYKTCSKKSIDLTIKVDLYFNESGYDIKILNSNISGNDAKYIKDILITPFLGATGGYIGVYDEEYGDYVFEEKAWNDGYIVIPDGAGSIVKMTNNAVLDLTPYKSNVYGKDPSFAVSNESYSSSLMTIKDAKLPVFGIAHDNAAFVAFGKQGNEYMTINVNPDNSNKFQYVFAYPSFTYNSQYNQVYNSAGEFYSTIANDINKFTLEMQYSFLANERANYVGMAKEYRDYLMTNGIIHERTTNDINIPMRLDFIMADAEKSLLGSEQSIVTNAKELSNILFDIKDNLNINNANVSLFGWQKEGKALQNPSKANLSSAIISASSYKQLQNDFVNYNFSLAENYYLINNKQMAYLNNASKHINGYYNKYYDENMNFVDTFSFAKANKSNEFIKKQYQAINKKMNANSMTLDGIGAGLVSDGNNISRLIAKQYIIDAFSYLKTNNVITNVVTPNDYLWKYVDRYYDIDVDDSSLLIESETIPFIQLVLQNTMELYSSYCNFSFYDQNAILKMVDYNVYPSFVLTAKSAYYLLKTNSSNYFSTQYDYYKEIMKKIYYHVNSALSSVINASWIKREVKDNVVYNTYSNNKQIIINYNDYDINTNGITIQAKDYKVVNING